jgi:anthranilate synthase component 2
MKIVLIDNYDSFTHILAQYIRESSDMELTILKNDAFECSTIEQFDKIVISPGPGVPSTNGKIIQVINDYSGKKPILGICLGLQAIYEAFGGRLINLTEVHHGVTSSITILDDCDFIFSGISSPFVGGRYHSWVCDPLDLPDSLTVSALDATGNIMACHHKFHPTYGVQFHPESILTPEGKRMIKNFLHH